MTTETTSRRKFLALMSAAGLAGLAPAISLAREQMPKRRIPGTHEYLPIIGLGSTKPVEVVFDETAGFFKRYSEQYDFNYLMMVAQGYQESRLDQSVRSSAGAVGIMQLLPSTAADPAIAIKNINKAEPNVHAGIKYMRWIVDNFFDDEDLDPTQQTLFAFASYLMAYRSRTSRTISMASSRYEWSRATTRSAS